MLKLSSSTLRIRKNGGFLLELVFIVISFTTMAKEKEIWLIAGNHDSTKKMAGKGEASSGNPWHVKASDKIVQGVKVSEETLRKNMSDFLDIVGNVFHQAEKKTEMKLDEVELSIEITADGEVKLLGSSVGIETKGAITLKFKRVAG